MVFDLSSAQERVNLLTKEAEVADFWSSPEAAQKTRELALYQNKLNFWHDISDELEELETLAELLADDEDGELRVEFYDKSVILEKKIEKYQLSQLLNEEFDRADAIISIHAGAGGLDSQDWAGMLARMYYRWSERAGFKVKILDELADPEGGIKSVTFEVAGENAYGYLKGEQGVHRLVRISPFDSAKRRHTSFSSIEALPVIPEDVEVEIRPEDLKLDTFRASGAGGQYVNMTDSAIRITHVPSGIVVACQAERSQHSNRAAAMQVLRAKLFDRQVRRRREQLENIQGEKRAIAWGSQIRSYTLQPFQLVKDHRINYETGNVSAVLDGELDGLIMAYLKEQKK